MTPYEPSPLRENWNCQITGALVINNTNAAITVSNTDIWYISGYELKD